MGMQELRKEYLLHGLDEREVLADPIAQFRVWFDAAVAAGLPEPNAMTLATVSREGRPAARVVLIKDFDAEGFVFYTNYASRKGEDLDATGVAAMVFYWPELERQVRVEGNVARVAEAESDAYFASRPLGSQLGAWTSPQSRVIAGRAELEARLAEVTQRFGAGPVPRPAWWGGYRLRPLLLEFWQGRPNRLHDRICYQRTPDGGWQIERLAP
ncbi:MAG: pyridoxamine 5'-phosphate oxidase [Chloroflexi bacterium]|nr:pyridoxamine 5'-phosphate oxidase [Chloroflexota bacterium]